MYGVNRTVDFQAVAGRAVLAAMIGNRLRYNLGKQVPWDVKRQRIHHPWIHHATGVCLGKTDFRWGL